jgi:type I restriction enzyme S subunit
MRDGWIDTVLGELAEITTGSRAKGGAITSGIPSIGGEQIAEDRSIKFNKMKFIPKDHFESMRTGKLEFGDSLLVKDGATTGKVGYWGYDIPAAVNEHVFILRAKPDCAEPYFINLLISHRPFREEIESRTRGIIGGITRDIENIELVVPTLSEQKRIVDLISSVDDYIEALQQQLESAKRSRNAVLHELLTAGSDDWIETSLGEIAEVVGGGTPSTTIGEYWDGDIVWLTPTEITSQDGKVVSDSIRKITDLGFKNSGAQMLPKDSVILTSRASVGFVALAGKELCTNQGFQSLIPKPSVLSKFLMFWIQQNRPEFESRSAGSTFKEISKSNVKSIKLQLPPLPEQKRIVEIVNTIDEVISQTELTTSKAKNLRSGLLSDLLSGEHEIPTSYDKVMGAA